MTYRFNFLRHNIRRVVPCPQRWQRCFTTSSRCVDHHEVVISNSPRAALSYQRRCSASPSSSSGIHPLTSNESSKEDGSVPTFVEAQYVAKIDLFAKSRVGQYLKRLPIVASPWIGGPQGVDAQLIGGTLNSIVEEPAASSAEQKSRRLFISRVVIPLLSTPPKGSDGAADLPVTRWLQDCATEGSDVLIATGIAHTSRADADALAAMHAERLLDATGRCLYVVGASQKRYAAQRKAEGGCAPLPGDPIRHVDVQHLPLPLALASSEERRSVREILTRLPRRPVGSEKVPPKLTGPPRGSDQRLQRIQPKPNHHHVPATATDETEDGTYMLCNVNTSRVNENPWIMTSPALIDPQSVLRVSRRLFGASDMLDRFVVTQGESAQGGDTAMITCTLHVTHDVIAVADGIVGKGKASTRERALQLCGMHLELLLYHVGVPLYPDDPVAQAIYDRAAENKGWRHSLLSPYGPLPLPLKELHPTYNEFQFRHQRRAALSNEEKFLRFHGEAFNHAKTTIPINSLHAHFSIPGFASVRDAETALEAFQRALNMRALAYIVARTGDYRTTLLLYNLELAMQIVLERAPLRGEYVVNDSAFLEEGAQQIGLDRVPPRILPVPAFGVAPTIAASKALCILHALEEINAMNLPLFLFDREKQATYAAARAALGLYVPDAPRLGHIPPQSRILHQANPDGEIYQFEKRERGGRDGGMFAVTMAYVPTPSFSHDDRRGPVVPCDEDISAIVALSTLRDFQVIGDVALATLYQFYVSLVYTYFKRYCHLAESCLPFSSIVEDQGSGWRHRSTVWLTLPIARTALAQPKTAAGRVSAVGRGTRLVEAERACVVHAALLLTHFEQDVLLSLGKAATETHTSLMRSLGRVASQQHLPRIHREPPSELAGITTLVECLPVVLQSTYESMKSHERLYKEMRSAAIQRRQRGA